MKRYRNILKISHPRVIARWITASRRRRITASTLFLTFLAVVSVIMYFRVNKVQAGWYNNSWPFRVKVTVDHTKVKSATQVANVDFETGDLSQWTATTTDLGDLSVTTNAAIKGRYGMQAVIDDTTQIEGRLNVTSSSVVRYRFYFDPNSVTMANADNFRIQNFIQDGGGFQTIADISLSYFTATGYRLSFDGNNDADTGAMSDYVDISDAPHYIEVYALRATNATSNDGEYEWWVDGVSQGGVSGVDNYNVMVDFNWRMYLTTYSNLDAGTSGTIYYDEFAINADADEIGEGLTDFPVYVDFSTLPLQFHNHVNQTDARDVRVTKIDGTTELPREIVSYDSLSKKGGMYFKYSGTLSNTEDTDIYLYYGNAAATDYAASATYGAQNAWDSNFVSVWHLDETVTDEATTGTHYDSAAGTGGAENGTQHNNSTVTGKIQNAQFFDGTADYIDVGDDNDLDVSDGQDFTVSAWISVDSIAAENNIVAKKNGNNGTDIGYSFYVDNATGVVRMDIADAVPNSYRVISNTALTAGGGWQYVSFVYKDASASGTNIYVNGTQDTGSATGTLSSVGSLASALSFRIGSQSDSGAPLTGNIDEVRFSNTSRSATWEEATYANQSSPATFYTVGGGEQRDKLPVVFYNFDEGRGNVAHNYIQNGKNADLKNTVSWVGDKKCPAGDCLEFDGSESYVSRPYDNDGELDVGTSTFSVGVRFRHGSTNPAGDEVLVSRYSTAGYKIYMNSSGQVCFGIDDDSTWTPDDSACSSTSYADSQWHHAIGVRNTSDITLYVDGVQVAQDASLAATGSLSGTHTPLTVGASFTGISTYMNTMQPDAETVAETTWEIDGTLWDPNGEGSNVIYTGEWGHCNWGGILWTLNAAIPSNAHITSAKAQFYSQGNDTNTTKFAMYLTDSADATSAAAAADRPSIDPISGGNTTVYPNTLLNGTKWPASGYIQSTDWPATGNWATSPDFSTLVQHLVDTYSGLSSGAHVVLWMVAPSCSGLHEQAWLDRTAGLSTSPKLDITYTTAAPGYWDGRIDDVKIYDYARTSDEVKADAAGVGSVLGVAAVSAPDDGAISKGLIGHWNMDETSWTNDCATGSVLDSSGNGHALTSCPSTTGPTGGTNGRFGKAGTFDGTDDYLQSTSSDFAISNAITISVWVNVTASTGGDDYIVDRTNNNYGISLGYNSSLLPRIRIGTTTAYTAITSSNAMSTGAWYHLTATTDNGDTRLYVNGVLDTSATTAVLSAASQNLRIGGRAAANTVSGIIDDVRIYNRALSPSEVASLNDWAPGPVGHWKLDEVTGTIAYDSSGNGFDGQLVGTGSARWAVGKYGGAGHFNGLDDQIDVGDISTKLDIVSTNPQSFTVEAWVRKTGTTGGDLGGVELLSSRARLMYRTASTTIGFQLRPSETAATYTSATYGTWYHAAGVYDSINNLIKLYIDGVLVDSQTPTSHDLSGQTSFVHIGNAQNFYAGDIDDVRIYGYERLPKQVVEDMNANHPAPGSPAGSPIGHWKFDEGTDNTCSGGTNDVCNAGSAGTTLDGAETGMAVPSTATSGWTSAGKFGKALLFDGTNDNVSIGDHTEVEFSDGYDFMISLWVKSPLTSTGTILAKKTSTTAGTSGYDIRLSSSGQLDVYIADGVDQFQLTKASAVAAANTWTHIAVVYDDDSATGTDIYINGVKSGATQTGTLSSVNDVGVNTQPLIIGSESDNQDYFQGTIDDVQIFNSVFTEDQIRVLYNQGSAAVMGAASTDSSGNADWSAQRTYCPPGNTEANCGSGDPSPLGEWNFDEGTGTAIHDTSGHAYDATSLNNINYDGNDGWKVGKYGNAFQLDGTDDNVQVANTAFNLAGSNFTLETWIKLDTTTTSYARIITEKTDASNGYHLAVVRNNDATCPSAFLLEVDVAATYYAAGCDATSLQAQTGTWYHVTATFDSSTNTPLIYVNGMLQAGTVTKSLGLGVTGTLTLGSSSTLGSNLLDGTLDQVRVYNYIRSQAQVAWDYNRGKPVGWWKFDEGIGTTASDSSGRAHHSSSFHGSPTWIAGKYNSGLDFENLTNDWVVIPDHNDLDMPTNDFSVCLWMKPETTGPQYAAPWEHRQDAAPRPGYELRWGSANQIEFFIDFGATTQKASTPALSTGVWYHICGVADRDGLASIYEDGKLVDTGNLAPNAGIDISSPDPAYIGDINASTTGDFDGVIDDVRVYNYALSQAQVRMVMNDGAALRFGPNTGSP